MNAMYFVTNQYLFTLYRYKNRSHPILFELSDTTPLKSKGKAPAEDLEGVIFDVEPAADELDDDE